MARIPAVLLLLALTLSYALWRWSETVPELAWSFGSLWPWFFFVAEMGATVYEVWSFATLVRLTDHSPQADAYERRLRAEAALPTVDVFIPTYNENREVLEGTIRGALALDYPAGGVNVWLLDDSRRPWLEDLCERRGVGYLARPTNEHGKAGNLNYAFAAHRRRAHPRHRRRLRAAPRLPATGPSASCSTRRTSPWCRRRSTSATPTPFSTTCSARGPGRRSSTSS